MNMQESDKDILFKTLLKKISWILETPYSKEERMQAVCELLRSAVTNYDWVGFYLVNPKADRELVLGPFSGAETEHVRIKFGQGICGQAADSLKTFIIDDVSKEGNYLSCSLHVKSEIVLPIFAHDRFIGELDIDSHTTAAFSGKDEAFLNSICKLVGFLYEAAENEARGNNR